MTREHPASKVRAEELARALDKIGARRPDELHLDVVLRAHVDAVLDAYKGSVSLAVEVLGAASSDAGWRRTVVAASAPNSLDLLGTSCCHSRDRSGPGPQVAAVPTDERSCPISASVRSAIVNSPAPRRSFDPTGRSRRLSPTICSACAASSD